MLLDEVKPSLFLAEYIRLYRIVDFHFPKGVTPPFKVYPPRPEHCLQFYPRDTEVIEYNNKELLVANKKATIVGQHTIVNHRHVGRDFLVFQVVFQPGAVHRITGIHSGALANVCMDVEEILGTNIRLVNEQLNEATSYAEMIEVVELYLSSLTRNIKDTRHPIDNSIRQMTELTEGFPLDKFVKEAFICHRQFDRRFLEKVGISPKQYLQIVRFDRAFRMKNRYPEKDWLSIALHCGYYDYQHMTKDYKEFTGFTPNQLLDIENKAPERVFGDKEI